MPRCPNCNEESYLTTAYDILHAEVIGSLLTSFGIPYHLKYRGAGDYLKVVLLSIKNVQKRQRNLSRLISMKILIFMGGKVRAVSGRD